MNEQVLTKIKSMTNLISESIYIELKDHAIELEPGKTIYNVEVKNISDIRPYVKIVENLTEVMPN